MLKYLQDETEKQKQSAGELLPVWVTFKDLHTEWTNATATAVPTTTIEAKTADYKKLVDDKNECYKKYSRDVLTEFNKMR